MRNTLYLVAGRCASGKDTLVDNLCRLTGWKKVVSFTDAPIRSDQTQDVEHHFCTKEGFDKVMEGNVILAYTQIGDYRYCATLASIVDKVKFYIIDPAGIKYLKDRFSEVLNLVVIYVDVPEEERRRRMLATRPGFDADTRIAAENEQFDEFERNCFWDICVDNTVDPETSAQGVLNSIRVLERRMQEAYV